MAHLLIPQTLTIPDRIAILARRTVWWSDSGMGGKGKSKGDFSTDFHIFIFKPAYAWGLSAADSKLPVPSLAPSPLILSRKEIEAGGSLARPPARSSDSIWHSVSMHAASMVSEDGWERKLAIGQTTTVASTHKCIFGVATSMQLLKTENFLTLTKSGKGW